MTPEIIFHRYFSSLPKFKRDIYQGRMDMAQFSVAELSTAFEQIRDEVNSRWHLYSKRIQTPEGVPQLHLDYIQSDVVNAITFSSEGIYFVGITSRMLVHFSRTCEALWGLDSLERLLEIDVKKVRDFLFEAILLIQLQFISSHELGHLFHGHIDRAALYEEFATETPQGAEGSKLLDQAHEVEADGYAVHLLLDNLIAGESGKKIHNRLGSRLSVEDCMLTLILLSIAALFFFLEPRPFNQTRARTDDHPFAIARMNVIMRDLMGWCSEKSPKWQEWASLEMFQWILACVQEAANNVNQGESWMQQSEFLKSDAGQTYFNELYAVREKLRGEMEPKQWKLMHEVL